MPPERAPDLGRVPTRYRQALIVRPSCRRLLPTPPGGGQVVTAKGRRKVVIEVNASLFSFSCLETGFSFPFDVHPCYVEK